MTAMYDKLVKANINYRQALYDKVVANLGIGLGPWSKFNKVEVGGPSTQREYRNIVGFDLGDINLFRSTDQQLQLGPRLQRLCTYHCQINGQEHHLGLNEVRIKARWSAHQVGREVLAIWNSLSFVETIARSTQPLDQEWVTNGADSFQWLVKKKSYDWLNKRKMIDTINEWSK